MDGCRRRKLGFENRQVGSIRLRFADPASLAIRPFGTTYVSDVIAVNLKTLDFSPLSEFLVGTGPRTVF
jgi:hypothetical protein